MEANTSCSPAEIWREALDIVKSKIPQQSFNTWFKPTVGSFMDDYTFRISVPNKFTADWINDKFRGIICGALQTCLGEERKLEFVIQADSVDPAADPETERGLETAGPVMQSSSPETHLNPRYQFDSFVVGDSNRFAHAGALAVAEAPMQTKYNPLYIYGGVGLGKTHLLQAVGNLASQRFSTLRVLYVTSEKFTNDFIEAIARARTSDFARYYRNVDLLLLDDIQFLTGKEATQEQFFHTFNALYQAGKQIVLTSDRTPRQIKGLEERLLSRFQCGLVADIQPPDLETRVAILNQMVQGAGLEIPLDVIEYIAGNIRNNIRELEGSIIKLLAFESFTGSKIDMTFAHQVLSGIFDKQRPITPDSICDAVCSYFRIDASQLRSRRKTADLVRARQVAMYLCRQHTANSLKEIGQRFGGRDHSTVIHALASVDDALKGDINIRGDIENINDLLKSRT
jgi:chromosomal replication initiator protein